MQRCIDHDSLSHPARSRMLRWTPCLGATLILILTGCSSMRAPTTTPSSAETGRTPTRSATVPPREAGSPAPALPAAGSGRGGYYLDDGPGEAPPAGLQSIPDAEPKVEPYSTRGNKPYVVFGKTYTPITDSNPLKQRGVGSWYGKKFHGQKTSSGELYDMYKMSAAHPTLPIPSYARVTNVRNGMQVIVRVNDRGPFHSSRIIDLSYTAALKLGYLAHGSTELEVERLLPDEIARMNSNPRSSEVAAVKQLAAVPVIAMAKPVASRTPGLSIDDFLDARESPARDAVTTTGPVVSSLLQASSDGGGSINLIALPANPGMPLRPANAGTIFPAVMVGGDAGVPTIAAGGFYLQFGAFALSSNAEAARQRLAQQWPTGLPALEVLPNGALYRLYSGPFGSRGDAVVAARLLSDTPSAKPMIVQR